MAAIAGVVTANTKGLQSLEPLMLAVANLPTLGAGDAALSVVSAPSTTTFFRGVTLEEGADIAATRSMRAGGNGNMGKYLTNSVGAAT